MTDNTERDAPKPVTTAFVRRHYSMGPTAYRQDGSIAKMPGPGDVEYCERQFDRWLADHDADVIAAWMRENDYEKREPFSGPSCPRCGREMSLSDEACDEHPEREPVVVDDATEWEYAVREVRHEGPFTDVYASLDDMREDFDVSEWSGPLAGEGEEVVRRRKAGPWTALTPDEQEGPWVDPLPWVYYDGTRRAENPYREGSANPYRVLWTYSPRLTPDGQEAGV